MAPGGSDLWNLFTVGNVLVSFLFLLLLHYLIELYQFRRMQAGPRLYSIPILGSVLSFNRGAGRSLLESTQRLVDRVDSDTVLLLVTLKFSIHNIFKTNNNNNNNNKSFISTIFKL